MSDFTISKIEPQKKSKNRFSIFSDNEFKIGVSAETLLKFELQVDKIITPDLFQQIQENEDYIFLKESALRFLSRRPHSIKELKDKLFNKSKNTQSINRIVKEFLENNYLNDTTFAESFIADEIRLKNSGPLLIKNKLLNKGVDREIIDSKLNDAYDEPIQLKNCKLLAEKKLNIINKKVSASERKSKLINYLKQKGYHWDIIKQVVESIIAGENDEE